MATIRDYDEERDSQATGRLIAKTYSRYNLNHLHPEQQLPYLGPFQHAHSSDKAHQAEIANAIQAPLVLVAEVDGVIVGVLRGSPDRTPARSLPVAPHMRTNSPCGVKT